MREIAPGATVRCVGGMYAGTTGRVESIRSSASGPYASVDVGETHPIAVFVTGLELVGTESPGDSLSDDDLRQCERDRTAWRLACLDAEQERDAAADERGRLRRELEALRDSLAHGPAPHRAPKGWVVDRLDAILRGES